MAGILDGACACAAHGIVVAAEFLPETRGRDLQTMQTAAPEGRELLVTR